LEFVDNRKKVVKGADGRRRESVGLAGELSRGRQNERRADDVERNRAAMEFERQETIGGIESVGRDGKAKEKITDGPDVSGGGGHGVFFLAADSSSLSRMR
jgi:hypothetical protein